jgi:tripartite-type tricarboxylate transporter receptor subunit TctC
VSKGVPPAVVERIHDEINKVLSLQDVRASLVAQGQDPRIETREAFESMVQADFKASAAVIDKAGVKLD